MKHLGHSYVTGRIDDAVAHLMAMNRWTEDDARAYIDVVGAIWELRSLVPWRLDLNWLEERGVTTPSGASGRRSAE